MGRKLFEFSHKNGDVTHYTPTVEILIDAISESGDIELKQIRDYSVHENAVMYKIHSKTGMFEDFWCTEDNSLLLHDGHLVFKESPKKILHLDQVTRTKLKMIHKNPASASCNIRQGGVTLLSLDDIDITYDPTVTTAYDFTVDDYYTFRLHDGIFVQDCMAAYFTITDEAEADLKENVFIDNNLFTDYDENRLTLSPGHDIVYGIYLLSKKKPEALPKPLYEYMKMKGWDLVDKKRLKEFLCDHIRLDKRNAKIIDEITTLGFAISTRYNQTLLSIDNIIKSIIPIEKRQALYDTYSAGDISMFEYMQEEEKLLEDLKKICIFSDLIESGSRGSWIQAKQIFLQRGFVSNSVGQVMATPVMRNLAEGLDSRELFLSCYGVRKGLADVADNTAVSGTFNRGLIYLGLEAKMGDHKKPCDTKRYLLINVIDKNMALLLLGRYVFTDDLCSDMIRITRENHETFINQTIRLRSPIYCTLEHYCHYCSPYKELSQIKKGKSYNVGVAAAAALGEPTTQMVLRVFHHSGAASKINEDEDDQDIIQDLRGAIRLFSKPTFNVDNLPDYVTKIYKTYSEYKEIPILYFEVLVSCLMWARSEKDLEEVDMLWRLNTAKNLELIGFNKVPGLHGFLLGCAFKNFKRRLLTSLGKTAGDSIFEKLILD